MYRGWGGGRIRLACFFYKNSVGFTSMVKFDVENCLLTGLILMRFFLVWWRM